MDKCQICGKPQKDDLFSFVTAEPVCSICQVNHIGGLKADQGRIETARGKLGLKNGEFLNQNNPEEARKILGR